MMIQIVQLPLGPIQTNCYILASEDTGDAAVIDPAWNGRLIAVTVEDKGWHISHILLTHAHFDHVGGLSELREMVNAPIYAHPDALPMLQQAPATAAMFQLHIPQPPAPEKMIQEGDEIVVGSIKLQVLHTPGHAPGHVCFYAASYGVVFGGDVLFQQSIGRTDLPGGDYDLLLSSIRHKLLRLPDDTRVLPGHGPATTIGQERQQNPFLQPE